MIRRASIRFTALLAENNLIHPDSTDWYIYGFEMLLGKIINYSILFLIGILAGMFWETLVFCLFFTSLRKQTGGYHAHTNWGCTLLSVTILGICLWAVSAMDGRLTLPVIIVGLTCCLIIVFLFAPVNHPNANFSSVEILYMKKKARLTLLAQSAGIILAFFIQVPQRYVLAAITAILSTSISMVAAKILKQEVLENESEKKRTEKRRP